jgi:general secretion pathway protein C
MQDLIKRYFWVLGAAVVMVCSVFAAKATSHIVEAKYLGDPDHAPRVQAMTQLPTQPKASRSKDGSPFATRDMFCSECTPKVEVNSEPGSISTTNLPLVLLATNVSIKLDQSYATIINTENQKQGSFSVGDPIPGASGKLKEIHFKYIDFENSGHIERLVLSGATAPITPVAQVTQPQPGEEKDDLQAAVDVGIKKIDDNNYEIDKSLVDKVLANPMGVAKGARVVPAVKDGKPDGFKLYAIRPSSVYAKLGLTNGDTLQSINGFELNSADKALEAYTKLREATSLEVDITRRGKPMTLKYSIR